MIDISLIGKEALTNQLVFKPNYDALDSEFDFFVITTEENFIRKGAKCLDCPKDELKAYSFQFEYGRSAFIMFKRSQKVTEFDVSAIIKRDSEDDSLSVKRVKPHDIRDYLLLKLLLNSLSNYSGRFAFNNISGKLFVETRANSKSIKALEISTDYKMRINATATKFTKVSVFKQHGDELVKINAVYKRDGNNHSLVRTWDYSDTSDLYIRKTVPGKKTREDFYVYGEKGREKGKVFAIYSILDILNERFSDYLEEPIKFDSLTIREELKASRDKKFMNNVRSRFGGIVGKDITCINMLPPGEEDKFEQFVLALKLYFDSDENGELGPNVLTSNKIDPYGFNVFVVHNQEWYAENTSFNDPYKGLPRNIVPIQCVTVEDFINSMLDNEGKPKVALFNTLLKELVIKDDIINSKTITLDHWNDLEFNGDWIIGIKEEQMIYLMTIHPNGRFEMKSISPTKRLMQVGAVKELCSILDSHKEKTMTIVSDDAENVNLISKSGLFVMPKETAIGMCSKSKESVSENLPGIFNINYYEDRFRSYYSAGMQYGDLQMSLANAVLVYQVDAIKGDVFIKKIIDTLATTFVKLDSFTVLPYPFKYLREWVDMEKKTTPEHK